MIASNLPTGARSVVLGILALLAPAALAGQSVGLLAGSSPRGAAPVPAMESGLLPAALPTGPIESGPIEGPTFLDRQLTYPRVRSAYQRNAERVDAVLEARGVEEVEEVFFRVFKREQELEMWVRESGSTLFTLVRSYPVCAVSGQLGPKRRMGDKQVPEGFYSIDLFNPRSNYHLSMRVDYPNAVDRVRGHAGELGGDIFVHGGCSTIGCVPVTDGYIEELYLVAADARSAGQRRIPIHIFPTRLDDEGLDWLADTYGTDFVDFEFWRNLQEGYWAFERTHTPPTIETAADRYTFSFPLPTPSVRTGVPTFAVAPLLTGPRGTAF